MKKVIPWIFVIIVSMFVCFIGINNNQRTSPNNFYQVYLDDQILGVIKDKKELEDYIDKEGSNIKDKYNVKKVDIPNGLDIKKIITFNNKTDEVKDVYKKLQNLKPFTIKGYQYTIKKEIQTKDGNQKIENNVIYVTNNSIFKESIKNTIIAFIGEENYNSYLDETQKEIETTGLKYDSIYVDNIITSKKTNIPVNEIIYNNSEELSQYILFSTTEKNKEYIVQQNDTIESVSKDNKISVQEFLVSNPEFTSIDNILYPGQVVSVSYADPVVDVVSSITKVTDQELYYSVEERPSDSVLAGDEETIQNGENGLSRIKQNIVSKNGFILKNEVLEQSVLKPSTNKIVLIGTKYISGVGGKYWTWPTSSTTIGSGFGNRCFSGSCSFHQALDITNYYGAPVYAANNGTVTMATYGYGTYGTFIAINHNNGYGSGYAHLSAIAPGVKAGFPVERGQLIGFVGLTGQTSGSHLHFEMYSGSSHPGFNYSAFINPYAFY
ncbi:MAG: M23 family metallopeptidase [Bacilli bacterium]